MALKKAWHNYAVTEKRQSGAEVALRYKPQVFRLALVVILAPALLSCACILMLDRTWLADVQSTKELRQEIDYDMVLAWAQQDLIAYKAKSVAFAAWGNNGSKQIANWERRKILDAVKTFSSPVEDAPRLEERKKPDCEFLLASLQEPDSPTNVTPAADGQNVLGLFLNNGKWATQTGRRAFRLCSKVLDRFDEDSKRLEELTDRESRLRDQAQAIVWAGMVSSLVLALCLVIFYTGWMNRRLTVLLNNARLLGRNEEMTPLPGQDELAYLNRALQHVDEELLIAGQQRRSIVEMVAHDVRSPLGGADISLSLIEKQPIESKTRSLKTNVAVARVNLRATVKFVEELLKSEKEAIDMEERALDKKHEREQGRFIFQSGLFKQLLVLVLVPLVIQIACLSFLYTQISATQSLSQAQQRQIEMVRTSAQIIMTSVRTLLGLSLATINKDPRSLAGYRADYQKEIELLHKAIASTPLVAEKQFWQEFQRQCEYTRNEAEILQRSDFAYVDTVAFSLSQKMTRLTQMIDTDRLIQELEHDHLLIQTEDLQNRMQGIQNFIVAALCLNLGVGFFLVITFSSNVNRRLKKLLANVKSFDAENVYSPAGGDDEIYELDEDLRTAKQEVLRAKERRHFIVSRIKDNIVAPLTVAMTAIEDIDEDVRDALPIATTEKLEDSLQSIYRVRQLVDDFLLGAATQIKLDKQDARLLEILTQSMKGVQSLAKQKKINLVNSGADLTINADSERMIQVFTNILSNAIKFSPQGSAVQISSSPSNGQVVVSIQDEGPGMDPSDAKKIFDKNFQTAEGKAAQGFGLGLTIARQIVEAHGGVITVESKKGSGSTFSVSLPRG